jgi:hypothetical protein
MIAAFFAVSSLPASLWSQTATPWQALPQGTQYDGQIPTPEQFFAGDFQIGNRHLEHHQLLDYVHAVDNASPRVSLETYAQSYGGRPLVAAIVTSPQNQSQLNELAAAHVRWTDPREPRAASPPLPVIYMGYSVHGNEASGANAAPLLLYHLSAAQGAEIEVKSGTAYQKRFYDGLPLLFGLGPTKEIDTIRITWPNGLIQNEPKQLSNRPLAFKEAQRLSGSCPMIFTWNGKKFEFITDVLGVAPLGASAGEGRYFPVDHDEYVQIPAESLAPVDGQYEIRITEELREVSYLDHIRLLAVEHPENIEIFTNDKFKGPPFPKFRLFGVQQRIYPRAARDHSGRDVRERLLRRDKSYPDRFERDYSGVAELHHVDLDFGNAAADNRAVLILNGWVDWADGSTFLAAEQTGKGLVLPYLQVKDAHGRWQTVIHDMGIPAGKPKTIAVDMTGKFLSPSREVRIVTNLCVYWDEVFLSEDTSSPAFRTVNLAAGSADLRFRGFSKPVLHPQRKQPESFDYGQWMPVSMWNPTPGYYTRYGDVMALLSDIDDRLVVMGSGDELRLRFPAYRARAGFTLSFLLFVDGWAKDGDANTSYSKTVAPLPFHGMKQYGEHRPDQEGYNTRPARQLLRPLLETP